MNINRKGNLPPVENQGSAPICVGSAFSALLHERGIHYSSKKLYHIAQKHDLIPGENYSGTQLIGVVNGITKNLPESTIFRQVNTKDTDTLASILQTSSIVVSMRISLNFWSNKPDVSPAYFNNKTSWKATLDKSKKHALLLCGIQGDLFLCRNSWGDSWGDRGYCFIHKDIIKEYAYQFGWYITFAEEVKKVKKKNRIKKLLSLIGILGTIIVGAFFLT